MKLNTKITTVILEIALIPLLLMGFIGYSSFTIDHSRQVIFALDAIAQIQKSRIQEELREKEDLLRLFVAGTPLRAHVLEYVAGPSAETQKNIYDDLASGMGSVDGIQKAYVADTAGVIFSSTDSSLIGKNIAAEDYYRLGIQRNDTTTLRRNGQTNALLQYLAGPIMVGGKTVAVVVIAVGANDIVSVIQDYAGLGNTGETLLVKKGIGGNALFMAPTRFDSQAALTRVTVKGNTGDPSLRAVEGEEVVVASATDYRGSPILAVTRYVEDAGWGIVVKIDKSQAMKETNNILWLFWFIVLIAGLLILFVGASISRSISSPLLELTRLAKRISQGDLSQSVLVVSRDETGELGRVFNKMTDTLRGYQYGLEKKIEERTAELQKKTDFILQEKAKDEAILGSIGEGVIVTSEEGRVLFMNAFALSVLGLKEKNSRGKFVPELFEITNEGGEKLSKDNCPVARVIIRREKFSTSDYYYSRPGQTRFPVTITAAPVILNGSFIGVIEVFRDITKEKDIDKAKTEFVSLASHQLRSPLSIIKWYAEMLLSGGTMKLRKNEKEYIEEIYRSNQSAVDLVDTLLDVSRLELGTYAGEYETTSVAKIIRGVVGEQKLKIKEKKLRCVVSIGKNVPIIQVDPKLLRMVFQNLLSNAIKYSIPKGRISVSLTVLDAANILFKVSDSGYGIPKDQHDRLFTKFFRASNVKQKTEGTGLGLYIVKSVVERLRGKVWFESEEDKGTTFFVSIPVA